jgi:cyclopropane fatty-acyl-phospholipid synthase-like methyltransferase
MVKSGKPVEKPEVHLGNDEERTRTFVMSMHYRALGIGQAVIPQLELSGKRRVFDVGGGPGTYSVLMAKANPELNCKVFDLPEVVKIAGELIEKQGMTERVKTIGGDYHTDSFPEGNDVVTFFGVLHQESPESIQSLFKKAYNSLNPDGIIYVMDMMTDKTHTKPKFSALFGINMALTAGNGWVFSAEELETWLEKANFADFKINPLPPSMPHWLASARKK